MSDFPISVTLKGGKDFDSPWIVLYGNTPDEVEAKLQAVISGDLATKTAEAAAFFRAQHNLAAGGVTAPAQPQTQQPVPMPQQGGVPQQPPVQNAWNQQPQQQNQPAQQQGEQCPACGSYAQYKEFTSKAGNFIKLWACPNGKSKGDGHLANFVK